MALVAKLELDSEKFEKGLDIASGGLANFGKGVGSMVKTAKAALDKLNLGAWAKKGVDAMKQGITDVAAFGDNIDKASQKLGISAKAYQEWEAVMQHSGTSMDAMTMGMKTLANAATEAAKDTTKVKVKADGTKEITEQANEARDAFKALGISYKDAAKMDRETLFKKSITALQKVKDANKRAQLAQDLFGRSAMELGPLLNTSAKDTQAMIDQVNALGGVMSDKAVKDSAAFQDSLQDMNTAIDGAKRKFFAGFLPSAKNVLDGITNIVAGLKGGGAKIRKGILKFTDNLIKELPKLIRKGLNIAEDIGGAILEAVPKVGAAVIKAIPKIWNNIVSYIRRKGIPAIGKLIGNLFGAVFGNKSAAGGMTTNLKRIFSSVMDILDKVGEKAKEFWNTVLQPILKDVLRFIKIQVLPGIQNTLKRIKPLIDQLSPIITQLFQNIKAYWDGFVYPVIQAAWDVLINKVIPAIIDWLGKIIPVVSDVFKQVSGWWSGTLLPVLKDIWTYVIEKLIPKVIDKINKLKPIVKQVFESVKRFWDDPLRPTLEKLWDYITKQLVPDVKEAWKSFQKAAKNAFEKISEIWENTLKPALEAIWKFIWEERRPFLIVAFEVYIGPAIENTFKGIKQWWEDYGKKALEDFQAKTEEVFRALGPIIEEGISDSKKNLNDLVDTIEAIADGDWTTAFEKLRDIVVRTFNSVGNLIKTAIKGPINAVIGWINQLIGKVEGGLNWIVDGINKTLSFSWDELKIGPVKIWDAGSFGVNLERVVLGRLQEIGEELERGAGRDPKYKNGAGRDPKYKNGAGRVKGYASGGILGPGELGVVGEFEPEWLRVVNGRAVVTPMSGQRRAQAQTPAPAEAPRNERPINIVFELEGAQKWVYRLNKAEEQRVGLKLSKGGPD